MRVFFISDIHGSDLVWDKCLKLVQGVRDSVIILGGDFAAKAVAPIVKRNASVGEYVTAPSSHTKPQKGSLDQLTDGARRQNLLPYVCSEGDASRLRSDPHYNQEVCRALSVTWLKERLSQLQQLELVSMGNTVVLTPGNDDCPSADRELVTSAGEGQVLYLAETVGSIRGFSVICSGFVNPTPWNTWREKSEDEIEVYLESLVAQLDNEQPAIFLLHCPPWQTCLDLAPKMSTGGEPHLGIGGIVYEHVGSKAVRDFIARHEPLLSLHGHVHESSGRARLGKTIALNPGSEYRNGILRAYEIETHRGVVRHVFRREW